jgi:hypothetical protein
MDGFVRASCLAVSLLTFLGGGIAAAQNLPVPAPPTKKLVIYNDSAAHTIYPVLHIGIKEGNPDLWMQAQLVNDFPNKDPYPPFPTTLVYRAYINPKDGIPPKHSVEITVPFYSQLKQVTADNIGVGNDQFIDWWNAARVYLFDGATALDAGKIFDGTNKDGSTHRPTPIKFLASAAMPTCSSDNTTCEPIEFLSYRTDPPFGVPFELQEYTFASAEGPPTHPRPAKIMLEWVNYNISSLDSVYLPVAVGPLTDKTVPYVGTAERVADFLASLRTFNESGNSWPYYLPVYFTDKDKFPTYPVVGGAACSLKPFVRAYILPKLPGTFNLLTASYSDPPTTPPVLSSNPPDFPLTTCVPATPPPFKTPKLGTLGQGVRDLWNRCTESNKDTGATCKEIRSVFNFFNTNYATKCGTDLQPDNTALIQAVYGWVPVRYNGCQGDALVKTPGYAATIATYCTLQYNYLDTTVPAADRFNPYTQLIHQTLESSSYAFSIDDELSFKHIVDHGIILSIGGDGGLVNKTPTPLPTLGTYKKQCRAPS